MLLYPNKRLWPVIFAVTLAIGSKLIFRARSATAGPSISSTPQTSASAQHSCCSRRSGSRHRYHFTENITGYGIGFFRCLSS
jgi:hypothetical protein